MNAADITKLKTMVKEALTKLKEANAKGLELQKYESKRNGNVIPCPAA